MLRKLMLASVILGSMLLTCVPASAQDPVTVDWWVVEKIYNIQEDVYEYIYTMDYMRDYGHTGPIFDWHVHLGNWTPGVITITPPANWAGTWQGGTYGCETNTNPYTYGNMYVGNWKITVKPGYGDGTTTYYFTDSLHNIVAVQHNVLVPVIPEPGSMLALGAGLLGLAGSAIRRRR